MSNPAIPGWPRALHLEWTAAYVGLGKSTWLDLVAKGEAPPPIELTPGRVAWLRERLDAPHTRWFSFWLKLWPGSRPGTAIACDARLPRRSTARKPFF